MSDLHTLDNVPIFQTGTWNGDPYVEADLDAIVAAYGQVGFKPPLKLGHDETQPFAKSDSMPAMGWVANLRRIGKILYADFHDMPKQIWEAVRRRAYNRVSAEIYWDFQEGERRLPRVLKAVALLGAEIPAVTSLQVLESLYAAQGRTVKAYMDGMPTMPMAPTEATTYAPPRKAKEDVSYQEAESGGYERCGACRFFQGPPSPGEDDAYLGGCAIVEGEVASTFVCDLIEVRDAFQAAGQIAPAAKEMAQAASVKEYIIRKRGNEWCLMTSDGSKTLGCHPTEEAAMAQERAVQASKHGALEDTSMKEYRYSVEEVEKFCPECAKNMRFLNLKELKITYDPVAKTYAGFSEGLCSKFAPGAGFRTRCMDSGLGASADEPGAMCNALETWCFDNGFLASKTSQDQAAKTHSDDARSTEGTAMTERKYAANELSVEKVDDEYCVMQGGKKVKCFPSAAQAQDHMEQEKQELEALKAKVATLEAAVVNKAKALSDAQAQVKTYEQQIAASEAEKAAADDKARVVGNTAWLDKMCQSDALRMLPAERDYAGYLLDVLSGPAGTTLKVYARTIKVEGADKTEEFPAAAAFKRLFEMRQPNTLLFRELTAGDATEQAGREAPPEGMAEARVKAAELAHAHIAAVTAKGEKAPDFRAALKHIYATNPELKAVAAGVRPEGAQKAADGAAQFSRVVAKKPGE